MDNVSKKKRSRIMAANKSKDTKPEKAVRSALYKKGYRFRLHRRELPGTPDIVLFRYKTAIFVNGCFWHQHGCKHTSKPKTRKAYWNAKFAANAARDEKNAAELRNDGWDVVVVWECEIRKNIRKVATQLDRVLKKRLRDIEKKEFKDKTHDQKKKSSQKAVGGKEKSCSSRRRKTNADKGDKRGSGRRKGRSQNSRA
jgi:DNA mismatch endonuclease (patch repair protein)